MLKSIVRTVVPLVVGWLISVGVAQWTGLSEENLTTGVTLIVTGAYYAAARLLEEVWPKAGVLLGWAQAPTYDAIRRPIPAKGDGFGTTANGGQA